MTQTATASTRRCEQCNGAVPHRQSRQRAEDGSLVCDSCKQWPSKASLLTEPQRQEFRKRAAEALRSITRTSERRCEMPGCSNPVEWVVNSRNLGDWKRLLCDEHKDEYAKEGTTPRRTAGLSVEAHDSGDNAILNHCPFCGSGAITGGSDGSVDCDYCHTVFTVQVQPAHPGMPQTIDGQTLPPPGMPAGQETEMSAPVDPAVDENPAGEVADPLGDAQADPAEQAGQATPGADQDPAKPGGGNQPPWMKKKQSLDSAKFFTADGDVLDAERYLRHLALDLADDRLAVLATVRDLNEA